MAHQDYLHLIRLAYEISSNRLRVTIPDKIGFASTSAYLYFRDARTLIISPDPHKGAVHLNFIKQKHLDGCRELHWPDVRNIGPHFHVMPVHYRVEGKDLAVEIPDEEHRRLPRRRGHGPTVVSGAPFLPDVARSIPASVLSTTEAVIIRGHGSEWQYDMTAEQLLETTAFISRLMKQSNA